MRSLAAFAPSPSKKPPKSTYIQLKDGRPVTTNRIVAEVFGKQHKDVLRAIETLECSEDFNGRNFALISNTDSRNRSKPMYEITRDGFMFLVMGFTGRVAGR